MTEQLSPRTRTRRSALTTVPPRGSAGVRDLLAEHGVGGPGGTDLLLALLPDDPAEVAEQALIENTGDGSVVGFCSFSRLDTEAGAVQVDVHVDQDTAPVGMTFEATMAVVDHAFNRWGVQRVAIWSAGERADQLATRPGVLAEAREMPEGVRSTGVPGARLFVITRDRWERYGTRFLEWLVRPPADR
ncbi:GNAT family N-acetyltransferase [Nocardiopsis trehalosi]|uniref:GNAT family N-acetyltransferase n=1 Tax=Nocardiopsis trehalosi TaxID=109329 RepID=UPI0012F9730C|nr:GNAT family protein [Nocardiopsis trehalosi]